MESEFMPQTDLEAERSTKSSELFPPVLTDIGTKRVEDMINLQSELFQYLQELNQNWLGRVQSEAELVTDFANKLTAARSVSDLASAYQEWVSRHVELLAQDGKRLFADTQKFMATGARRFNGGSDAQPPGEKSSSKPQ